MRGYRWLTPAAPAAIAVLRLPARADLVDRQLPPPGRARLARLVDGAGAVVDEVVVWRLDEAWMEIHSHGGPGVRAAIGDLLAQHGLHPEPHPVDRWARLAAAPAPAARDWLLAHTESELPATPFPARFLERCPVILITGPANAGKSTLLNAWCGHRRALVSDLPGTTRDLLAAETEHRGWRLRLLDSAGLRAEADGLERAGQELVARARAECDAIVELVPTLGGSRSGSAYEARVLRVVGKADLAAGWPAGPAWAGPEFVGEARAAELLADLGDHLLARLGLPPAEPEAAGTTAGSG